MSRSPIFPIPEPHHFTDYGFDPQIDYFQVLEEARRHVRRGEARGSALDSLHLKLQKPISKEKKQKQQQQQQQQQQRHRRRWWRSAGSALLLLWKRPKPNTAADDDEAGGCHRRPRYTHRALSGPLYVADGDAGEVVGCRAIRPTSGPLAASEVGTAGVGIPYLSLRDLNFLDGRPAPSAPPPMPIYLVT